MPLHTMKTHSKTAQTHLKTINESINKRHTQFKHD